MARTTKFRPYQRACLCSSLAPPRPTRWPALEEARHKLVRFCRDAGLAGLVVSTCGNASLRTDQGVMVLSGTGTELAHLTRQGVSEIEIGSDQHLGGAAPSSERGLHREAYLARPDLGAVLHCQSMSATLLACSQDPPRNLNFIPEIPAYVRRHAYVPYLRPGGQELAEAVAEALRDPEVSVVQLRNHGQVVVGRDAPSVLRRAIFFERACWIAMQGRPHTLIPEEEAEALWKRYGEPARRGS